MEKITQEELDKILRLHKLWLQGKSEGKRADLSYCDLSGLDLSDANLVNADLRGADLRYTNLTNADLTNIDLIGADLRYTDLFNADLIGADLRYTDLIGADLTDTNLTGINLKCANLTDVNLTDANLRGANLTNANLSNINLRHANLINTDLTNTKGLPSQEEILDKLFEKIEEGYIVYKVFGLMYDSPEYWDIKKGSIIEEEVDMSRRYNCSYGINVATKEWIENDEAYDNQSIWKCLLRFEDLDKVCVPYGTDGKIRCGRLKLLY